MADENAWTAAADVGKEAVNALKDEPCLLFSGMILIFSAVVIFFTISNFRQMQKDATKQFIAAIGGSRNDNS